MGSHNHDGYIRPPMPAGWTWTRVTFWATIATASSAFALFAIAQVVKLGEQSKENVDTLIPALIVAALTTLIATGIGKLGEVREKRAKLDRDWQIKTQGILSTSPRNNRLPKLVELSDTVLGITPTKYTRNNNAPYVARTWVDTELKRLLKQPGPPYPFIVVYGDSKAGKSRTIIEATRHVWNEAPVLAPTNAEAIGALSALDPKIPLSSEPAILWLDDLTPSHLDRLTSSTIDGFRQHLIIIGTITSQRYNDIVRTGSEVGSVARAALRSANCVLLPFSLTEEERRISNLVYPEEKIEVSIGESLVGGEELLAKLDSGRANSPAGLAIVQAAVDLRRVGLNRPLRSSELKRLFPGYLHQVYAGALPNDDTFEEGLSWAANPVASQVAILKRTAPNLESDWEVLDYIVATESGQNGRLLRPVASFIWVDLLDMVDPEEALAVGSNAYYLGEKAHAETAFRKAQQNPESRSGGGLNLGVLLSEQGKIDEAREAYQVAIDSTHPDNSVMAMVNMGTLLSGQGEHSAAAVLYQRAIDSGHPSQSVKAEVNLAAIYAVQGDLNLARAILEKVVDSDHFEHVPMAEFNLGVVLTEIGDIKAAQAAFRRSMAFNDPRQSPIAAFNLGILLSQLGRPNEARPLFEQVVASGHPNQALKAVIELALQHSRDREYEMAYGLLRQVIRSGHKEHSLTALVNLGNTFAEEGRFDEAREVFEDASKSSDARIAIAARYNSGTLLAKTGKPEEAASTYQQVIDSNNADFSPRAAISLALLQYDNGDREKAISGLQKAVDSGHPEYAPTAAFTLGRILTQDEMPQLAAIAYQVAIASGHPEHTPAAAMNLGLLYTEHNKPTQAVDAFRKAIEVDHADISPIAAFNLAVLYEKLGNVLEARNFFQLAADSGHPRAAKAAVQALRKLGEHESPR